jgi:hypothetical protein
MMRAWMAYVNLLMTSLFVTAPPVASAADYVWRNVKVGGGGFAPGIVFSRAERGLAYLRTDMGGAYRWDAAARSWKPLEDSIAESNYFGVEASRRTRLTRMLFTSPRECIAVTARRY